jgi:uncharacterized protein
MVPAPPLVVSGCGETPAPRARSAAQIPLPPLTGRVMDTANLLTSADEAALTARSADLEKATGHQFVIVTLPSLDGRSIEKVGLALANGWGIGRKDADDGVLLIVAPTERKVRIEVGCGLETTLTDGEADTIIQQTILPRFRKAEMPKGIAAGAEAIIREISK